MTKHAVGVFNGNFRNGDYFRYAQSVSKAKADLCQKCGGKMSLPMYLVGKSDVCYSCYEADKEAKQMYGPTWEADADRLHELLNVHPADLASALDLDPQAEARETERDLRVFGPVEPWGEFTHDDYMSENEIANECRGGL